MARFFLKEMRLDTVDNELIALYIRFAKLQKQIVRLNAELDNVRELIRQKGVCNV